MTYNELVGKICKHAKKLVDLPIDELRAMYPELTDTREELIRLCKDWKLSRGQLIEAILYEEYDIEFDYKLERE